MYSNRETMNAAGHSGKRSSSLPPVEIVAPCAMKEGFTFMAIYNDESLPVTVPRGGVKEGQIFSIPYPTPKEIATEMTPFFMNYHTTTTDDNTHKWKDSWWQCFRLGICHASVWNAACCPQLLAAQLLTRLELDLWGTHTTRRNKKRTFRVLLAVLAIYWCLTLIVTLSPQPSFNHTHRITAFLYNIVSWGLALYMWFIVTRLRAVIRSRFNIPSHRGEDCCMALWCSCCSLAQMARQTGNDDEQQSACCSTTVMGTPNETVLLV